MVTLSGSSLHHARRISPGRYYPRTRRRPRRSVPLPRPDLPLFYPEAACPTTTLKISQWPWKPTRLHCKDQGGCKSFLQHFTPSACPPLQCQKKRLVIFYGSQTGTAEEYAIRIAKEAKSKFGLTSLVCDPEEYDFENLDQIPQDTCVFFVVATYGEGEPTDNAVQLMSNLEDESFEFSNGSRTLDGLKYVVFALGNRTYEHYNAIGRKVDSALTKMGAIRIGERGEGDDDKSMEEDYLEWKDGMWQAFAEAMGVEEGQGGDTPDFTVTELESHSSEKVYLGESLRPFLDPH